MGVGAWGLTSGGNLDNTPPYTERMKHNLVSAIGDNKSHLSPSISNGGIVVWMYKFDDFLERYGSHHLNISWLG
jgi:hypothetical protein